MCNQPRARAAGFSHGSLGADSPVMCQGDGAVVPVLNRRAAWEAGNVDAELFRGKTPKGVVW